MKDQVKNMRWVVFLLLVVSLVFAGAALAMAEGGVLGAIEGTKSAVSIETTGTAGPVTGEPTGETVLPAPEESGSSSETSETAPSIETSGTASVETTYTFPFKTGSGSQEATVTVTLERTNNHGAYVSAFARADLRADLPGLNHGQMVRQVAKSSLGKKGNDESSAAPEAKTQTTVTSGRSHRATKSATSSHVGAAKGHGRGHNK